jgi:2,4-dienoyl-CoA reductase-like NADH-dependent reductase (Old Yellow Enzyme family)/thioredoxin reductase
MAEFTKLFEPGKMGKVVLKNRIIMAPCGTHYSSHYGVVTDQQLAYYGERAKGGAGVIVTEGASTRKPPRGKPGRILVNEDKFIPGLKKLADVIHDGGAKAVMQMSSHQGSMDEVDPASPSGIPHPYAGWSTSIPKKARIITVADMQELIEEYGEAARRIMEAGFDGVMIHGANGYLACELLSRVFNKRTDAYGGDLKGRAKYLLDMMAETRRKTSPDFPVILRLMGSDRLSKIGGTDGWSIEECVELCKIVEANGATAVNITSGSAVTPEWTGPAYFMPDACNVDITEAVKKSGANIPVWITGKIDRPSLAEEILRDGKADFICMGRALICDPYWPTKVKEGRVEDICPCIWDKRCIEDVVCDFSPMSCTVNPLVGKEREFQAKLPRVTKEKNVLVLGGGPGGMQAAIIAAQKGHKVTLWEKSSALGGQLVLAAIPPDKQDLGNFLTYLKIQVAKAGVKVVLNKQATADEVKTFAPDSVIVAVGSTPFVPDIPGIKGKNVINCREFLAGEKSVGKNVVVIGAGHVGCETCFALAEKGANVTLTYIEPALEIKYWMFKKYFQDKLAKYNIKIYPQVLYRKITEKGVELTTREGETVFLTADNIVLAAGSTPDRTLPEALKGKYLDFAEIGDCVKPRKIREAVEEGIWAAADL